DLPPPQPGCRLPLPGEPVYVLRDPSPVARFDGPPPAASCGVIESFAEQLHRPGIDYDYQPSSSPQELVGPDSISLRGHLTGGFASTAGSDESGEVLHVVD